MRRVGAFLVALALPDGRAPGKGRASSGIAI
jgi:hypothetical protein